MRSSSRKSKVQNGRVFLRTEKTGIPVWVPVPPEVTKAIEAIDEGREFYFWSGASTLHTATNKWRARLSKLFKLAGVNGHPHMFRHTLAVTMLGNGSSLETVAAILGNTVRIVEKHYSPWVKSRQEALEAAVKRAWA
jgi:integrase